MARSQIDIISILNEGRLSLQPFVAQWQSIYYRTSIHTTGACPMFYPLSCDDTGAYNIGTTPMYPAWWISENYDILFNQFLLNRYPREPKIIHEFRKSVYRPYQMAALMEAINSLKACIFGDNKYTLNVEDQADNDYIWGDNFEGKTLVGYFEWMFKAICEDPNSIFVVVPKYPRTQTQDKVEPIIKHIPSTEIVWIDEEEIVYYEPFSGRNMAWWITQQGYFRFRKVNEQWENIDGNDDGYFAHLLHRKPLHFAGGLWNTLRYYDSYLKAALPYCDDFVAAHSDLQMINKEACFPFIQMVEQDCPTCSGYKEVGWCGTCHNSGSTCSCDGENTVANIRKVKCPSCNGSGHIMSFNPGQRILVPKDMADKELMKIINFDVNVNKYTKEYAHEVYEGIRKSLHQQFVDEAQSGTAKEIDREGAYLFRGVVSSGVWGLIEAVLKDILSLRHSQVDGGERVAKMPNYELVKPTDFALKTEFDLLAEYKESTTANMPAWVRQNQMKQYVDKVFGGSDVIKKKNWYINQKDPYSVHSIADKNSMLAAGGIDIYTFTLSNNISTILDAIIRDVTSDRFVDMSYDEIDVMVDEKMKTIPQPAPKANEQTVNKIVTD